MKQNYNQHFSLAGLLKAFSATLNSLFFTDNNREFQRLKNFIAS